MAEYAKHGFFLAFGLRTGSVVTALVLICHVSISPLAHSMMEVHMVIKAQIDVLLPAAAWV